MTKIQSLIDVISAEMASDDANRETQSERLALAYAASSDQVSLDFFLIALCGWTFEALKKRRGTSKKLVTHTQAIRLWATGKAPLYRLYGDDADEEIETADELVDAISNGIELGIDEDDIPALKNL